MNKRLIKKLLIEHPGDDDTFKFKTALKSYNVTVSNPPENQIWDDIQAVVEWELQFELRDWGVKDLSPAIRKVTLFGQYTDLVKDEPVDVEMEVENGRDGWQVQEDTSMYKGGVFAPEDISVDLSVKVLDVEF